MKGSLPRYLTTSPVIVCGLPRSGTSLTRDLINTSSNVLILDEFPSQRFPALFKLAEELAQADREPYETWRGLSSQRTARALELISTAWVLASRDHLWHRFRKARLDRIGMKTPLAELDYGHYERLLGSCAPVLVYCWRPPLAVYDSLLSLAWGTHYTPESFTATLESSLEAVVKLRSEQPEKVFVFEVARTLTGHNQRRQAVASLFSFLQAKRTWRTIRFVAQWPEVNSRKKGPPSPLSPEEKQVRLGELSRLLRQSEKLATFCEAEGVMLETPLI